MRGGRSGRHCYGTRVDDTCVGGDGDLRLWLLPHSEELPHLLPPRPHHLLVLAYTQLLAVDDAGALGPGLVLVVGILLQVDLAEPCLLLIKWLFLLVRHGLPARSQDFADVGVVHVWEGLKDFAALIFGPNHEGVHGPFDVRFVDVPSSGFPVDPCLGSAGASLEILWPGEVDDSVTNLPILA